MFIKFKKLQSYITISLLIFILFFSSCNQSSNTTELNLPDGFISNVFVDSIAETVRHMDVKNNGDLYVKFRRQSDEGVLAAIRDLNSDGVADSIVKFGQYHIPQRGS